MVKTKNQKPKIEDEPGAEDRFMRGVENALNTPPKPFTPTAKKDKGDVRSKRKK